MGYSTALPRPPAVRAAFFDDERRGCKDISDPAVFFPEVSGAAVQARAICNRCPVRDACREWAIRYEPAGVWGGLSAEERDMERRRRAGTAEHQCEICGDTFPARRPGQRACGAACARRLTKRGLGDRTHEEIAAEKRRDDR
jgi:WhiB family redox-sensing transcriptional regulator